MHIPLCVRLLLHKSLQIAKLRKDEIPFCFAFVLPSLAPFSVTASSQGFNHFY